MSCRPFRRSGGILRVQEEAWCDPPRPCIFHYSRRWTRPPEPRTGAERPSRLLKLLPRPSHTTPWHNHPAATAVTLNLCFNPTKSCSFLTSCAITKQSASSTAGRWKHSPCSNMEAAAGTFQALQMFFSGRGQCEGWRDKMERLWWVEEVPWIDGCALRKHAKAWALYEWSWCTTVILFSQ